ncbi:MAG: HAD family hydrolase [Pseudobdellovibrionaceae bacterium]
MAKVVVFDLDGTLIDSEKHCYASFDYALEPFGIKATKEILERIRGRGSFDLFDPLLKSPVERTEALDRLNWFSLEYAHEQTLYDGVEEVLDSIKSKGTPIALWTGRDHISAEKTLKLLNIRNYFSYTVGACLVKNNKPHPEGLFLIAKELKLDPKTIVHVGDHHHDVEGARAAEALSIGANWHTSEPEKKSWKHEPHHQFNCIFEFKNWVNDRISSKSQI